jgi:hypothetical protein
MRHVFASDATLLTYVGILPFWLSALAMGIGWEEDRAFWAFRAYGAVIVSFIGGLHWAIAMKEARYPTRGLLATSNGIALVAWCSLLLDSRLCGLALLALALLCLLWVDARLHARGQIDDWLMRLRWRATLLVLVSLVGVGVLVA